MIEFKVEDGVGEIVIARAGADNAFTGDMVRQLAGAMRRAADRADIVTLRGQGADFTVGRDRGEPKSGPPFDAFRDISVLNTAIADFPGILIACVRGRAYGLGIGLIMRSDIAIAATDARFALDEVKVGIPPMFVMEEIVNHLSAKRALDIVLSSREFDAGEALEMGLVSRVVPAVELDQAVRDFVGLLHGRERSVLFACKRYLKTVAAMPANARSAFALVAQTQFALQKQF